MARFQIVGRVPAFRARQGVTHTRTAQDCRRMSSIVFGFPDRTACLVCTDSVQAREEPGTRRAPGIQSAQDSS